MNVLASVFVAVLFIGLPREEHTGCYGMRVRRGK
jgi:hypothetical protein